MGAVKKEIFEIEEAIEAGRLSFTEIAEKFNVALEDVYLIAIERVERSETESKIRESLTGEFWSDEDYCYCGEE